MIRVGPCDEPSACPRSWASIPRTRPPRAATLWAAALPMIPRPTTMTSHAMPDPRAATHPVRVPLRGRCAVDEAESGGPVAEQFEHRVRCELPDRRIEREEPVLLGTVDRSGVP